MNLLTYYVCFVCTYVCNWDIKASAPTQSPYFSWQELYLRSIYTDSDFRFAPCRAMLRDTQLGSALNFGPILWFLNIFAEKVSKNIGIICSNCCQFLTKLWSQHWFMRKSPSFSPKIGKKSQKLVIITSTPGRAVSRDTKITVRVQKGP
jgi:hypothetical protein